MSLFQKDPPIGKQHITFAILLRIARGLSPIISSIERKAVESYKWKGEKVSPIFIIGVPRCGTTFFYQALTDRFKVHYIDNLAHIFYKNLYSGCRLSDRIFGARGHGNFDSREGNTVHAGFHAPSECGPFWYLSFSKSPPGPEKTPPSHKLLQRVKDPINATMGRDGTPFLIKNLMNVERLPVLKELFPTARFVVLERDRLSTAHSILKARERLGIPPEEWWSVRPKNYQKIQDLPLYQRIAAQVHYLEDDIEREMEDVPDGQKTFLRYERFCANPEKELKGLHEGILQDLDLREDPSQFVPSRPVSKEEMGMKAIREGFLKLGLPYEK